MNDRVRLTHRGVVHIVWGKKGEDWRQARTVCGRSIAKFPRAELIENGKGTICHGCDSTPVATFGFKSGATFHYYAK